eukprot:m.15870 g.15870  ORF g.15870 m.15870 type:complete len:55 (+) comp7486_c0_seq1:202-366(+)
MVSVQSLPLQVSKYVPLVLDELAGVLRRWATTDNSQYTNSIKHKAQPPTTTTTS